MEQRIFFIPVVVSMLVISVVLFIGMGKLRLLRIKRRFSRSEMLMMISNTYSVVFAEARAETCNKMVYQC